MRILYDHTEMDDIGKDLVCGGRCLDILYLCLPKFYMERRITSCEPWLVLQEHREEGDIVPVSYRFKFRLVILPHPLVVSLMFVSFIW